MTADDPLLAALAAVITDEMPQTAKIADGSPVLFEGGARFHVDWEAPEAPHGRRRRRIIIVFSQRLLETLGRRREENEQDHAQALALISDELAAKFLDHDEDTRHVEWFVTEELLSDEGEPEP